MYVLRKDGHYDILKKEGDRYYEVILSDEVFDKYVIDNQIS